MKNHLNTNDKYILYYVVSEIHIKNYIRLKKLFKNKKFILVYENTISKNIIKKYNEVFYQIHKPCNTFVL